MKRSALPPDHSIKKLLVISSNSDVQDKENLDFQTKIRHFVASAQRMDAQDV
jgi:hypothetical protein